MDTASFEFLLKLVTPHIERKDTKMRKAISSGERLALTLRYLASAILKVVCNALVTVLKDHLQTPATEAEWESVNDEFHNLCQFPMCIGALDGKHVKISPLRNHLVPSILQLQRRF
ncbi:hypothetical protein AVEN_128945-1 [Araneus ventricosus]|uniref:DDE Tnp4 domain-containing protein n=1 Tax=Araneus ventricosus TaxID=182803 RepID=A0A4Y2QVQ3_ARAVE|nr:hypothetical protein AVEN_128945-1 [Araneus ventricosus]